LGSRPDIKSCLQYVTPENYGGALRCITFVRYSSVLRSYATCVCMPATLMCHLDTPLHEGNTQVRTRVNAATTSK